MSDIGATLLAWWQLWQLRCRIGKTFFVNVGEDVISAPKAADADTTAAMTKIGEPVILISTPSEAGNILHESIPKICPLPTQLDAPRVPISRGNVILCGA